MTSRTVKRGPRGRGPQNTFGFRNGTRAALVSDLIGTRATSLTVLKRAVEREFGETTNDQFKGLIDFVVAKLRKQGWLVVKEQLLSIEGKGDAKIVPTVRP